MNASCNFLAILRVSTRPDFGRGHADCLGYDPLALGPATVEGVGQRAGVEVSNMERKAAQTPAAFP